MTILATSRAKIADGQTGRTRGELVYLPQETNVFHRRSKFKQFSMIMCSLALTGMVCSQEPQKPTALELPECDIFLFDLIESDDGLSISNARNITNRPGYDNQPWFTPNSESILYSANGAPDRTDVYEYFFESGETKQVTDSPDQEYSPQISPDNRTLSFVTDGPTANQSIWSTERESGVDHWLLKTQGEREPVGYYSWNHRTGDLLYWSRYGFSIRLVRLTESESHYISGNAPPTSPHIIPGTDKFSFVHQQGNGEVWIKELDPETLAVRPLTIIAGSNRNYAWMPGGQIVMANDGQLFRWSPDSDGWQAFANLGEHGLTGVTRVSVSPDGKKLAVVGSNEDD